MLTEENHCPAESVRLRERNKWLWGKKKVLFAAWRLDNRKTVAESIGPVS